MKVKRAGCVLALWIIALLCGSGATAFTFSQHWLPGADLPNGYTALVCARVGVAPPRLEATILLPQLRSVSAMFSLPGRCAWLPWLPALPHNFHFQIPP